MSRWLQIVAALLLLCGLIWLLNVPGREGKDVSSSAPVPALADRAASVRRPGSGEFGRATSTEAGHTVPNRLPPDDLPLAQVRAELESRALAGDNLASLRLYRDYKLCVPATGLESGAMLRRCMQRTWCADVHPVERWRWLLLAAHQGNLSARVELLSVDWSGQVPPNQRRAYVEAFARYGLSWAMDLARRGHPIALIALSAAYAEPESIRQSPLARTVPHDRLRAAVYHLLAHQRIPPTSWARIWAPYEHMGMPPLTPQEVAWVSKEVQRWMSRHPTAGPHLRLDHRPPEVWWTHASSSCKEWMD